MPHPEFFKITPRNTFFNKSIYEGMNSFINRFVTISICSMIIYGYILDKNYNYRYLPS